MSERLPRFGVASDSKLVSVCSNLCLYASPASSNNAHSFSGVRGLAVTDSGDVAPPAAGANPSQRHCTGMQFNRLGGVAAKRKMSSSLVLSSLDRTNYPEICVRTCVDGRQSFCREEPHFE
jgi:hypothetical protein